MPRLSFSVGPVAGSIKAEPAGVELASDAISPAAINPKSERRLDRSAALSSQLVDPASSSLNRETTRIALAIIRLTR
jgi:hypothetical protein